VRSRKTSDLHADILEGHQSTALCHAGNISYRLGRPASPGEFREKLSQIKASPEAQETLERTRQHLEENGVDSGKTPLTLGAFLRIEEGREHFVDNVQAEALLTRQYRAPFVLPARV
jgi:hypothetical protein